MTSLFTYTHARARARAGLHSRVHTHTLAGPHARVRARTHTLTCARINRSLTPRRRMTSSGCTSRPSGTARRCRMYGTVWTDGESSLAGVCVGGQAGSFASVLVASRNLRPESTHAQQSKAQMHIAGFHHQTPAKVISSEDLEEWPVLRRTCTLTCSRTWDIRLPSSDRRQEPGRQVKRLRQERITHECARVQTLSIPSFEAGIVRTSRAPSHAHTGAGALVRMRTLLTHGLHPYTI
jgi:hypothetical protein